MLAVPTKLSWETRLRAVTGDEAWFGVTSAVAQSDYGSAKPDIRRTPYKAYDAVKEFYGSSSRLAAELYQD